MDVQILANTTVRLAATEVLDWEMGVTDADYLAEFTARDCYQSHHRPNATTATNQPHLANCIEHGHFSVMEHASVTFRVTGVSRSLTHELVRHRHFSPSQLSQRFVDSATAQYVVPPLIDAWPDEEERREMVNLLEGLWIRDIEGYERLASIMGRSIHEYFPQYAGTMRRKRIREAARAVMPNMAETLLDITGNHRAFREFAQKRAADAADLEIQMLARQMLRLLLGIAPNTYQDLTGLL
jgi:thymidylate synthase (FAD)